MTEQSEEADALQRALLPPLLCRLLPPLECRSPEEGVETSGWRAGSASVGLAGSSACNREKGDGSVWAEQGVRCSYRGESSLDH